jgi:Ca2+-binding RTX toxin-like protein
VGDGTDTVTLTDAPGTAVNVKAGNGKDVITLGAGNDTVQLGDGNNHVVLGNGNDTVKVGNGNNAIQLGNGHDKITLGNGNDVVTLGSGQYSLALGNRMNEIIVTSTTDSLRITNFKTTFDDLVVSAAAFNLGIDNALAGTAPQPIAGSLFSPNTNGTFATPQNRFAYDQKTGNLWYDADGSNKGSLPALIGSFQNQAHLTASNLFFIS